MPARTARGSSASCSRATDYSWGFNAATGEYQDLVKAGVIDPAKVVRTALQDAASVASLLITTEALIAELPKEEGDADAGDGLLTIRGRRVSAPPSPHPHARTAGDHRRSAMPLSTSKALAPVRRS